MSKIDSDVDYFFFLRAFVFFAVFLVAAFVFLFFAIAALLIWVDGDIGAVQSRIDVHYSSDYYSGKKITVTPLNFVCKRRTPPPPRKRLTVFRKIGFEQIFSSTSALARCF
jgi:hypothetical protein